MATMGDRYPTAATEGAWGALAAAADAVQDVVDRPGNPPCSIELALAAINAYREWETRTQYSGR